MSHDLSYNGVSHDLSYSEGVVCLHGKVLLSSQQPQRPSPSATDANDQARLDGACAC